MSENLITTPVAKVTYTCKALEENIRKEDARGCLILLRVAFNEYGKDNPAHEIEALDSGLENSLDPAMEIITNKFAQDKRIKALFSETEIHLVQSNSIIQQKFKAWQGRLENNIY